MEIADCIFREAVVKYLEDCSGWYDYIETEKEGAINDIKAIPAADVRPVVRAENIAEGHPADDFHCSNCGIILRDWTAIKIDEYGEKEIFEYVFEYCPNCGAKS